MPSDIHILVADDFACMRRIVIALLRELGYSKFSEADNGERALKLVQSNAAHSPIDFIITDWNMPIMDGLTLLQTLRAGGNQKNIPVLMVTAEAKKENIVAAAEAGADGYIVKPFSTETLKEKLEKILNRRRLAA